MNDYFCNLKVMNDKGQRVAVFGSFDKSVNEIQMFELTCSRKDQFSKKVARKVYEEYLLTKVAPLNCESCLYHPKIHTIIPEHPEKPKLSFLKWVGRNFWRENTLVLEPTADVRQRKTRAYIDEDGNLIIKIQTKWES